MAIAPSPADMPPPDAAPTDAPMPDDTATESPVLFTVMGPPEGPYTLMAGDEPEGEGDMAGDAPKFDTPQALMKGIMDLLNPGSAGAEDAFSSATKSGAPKAAPEPMA